MFRFRLFRLGCYADPNRDPLASFTGFKLEDVHAVLGGQQAPRRETGNCKDLRLLKASGFARRGREFLELHSSPVGPRSVLLFQLPSERLGLGRGRGGEDRKQVNPEGEADCKG